MGVDLQLSGHTHGGQIWPFRYLVRLSTPFVAGYYRRGTLPALREPRHRLLGPGDARVRAGGDRGDHDREGSTGLRAGATRSARRAKQLATTAGAACAGRTRRSGRAARVSVYCSWPFTMLLFADGGAGLDAGDEVALVEQGLAADAAEQAGRRGRGSRRGVRRRSRRRPSRSASPACSQGPTCDVRDEQAGVIGDQRRGLVARRSSARPGRRRRGRCPTRCRCGAGRPPASGTAARSAAAAGRRRGPPG